MYCVLSRHALAVRNPRQDGLSDNSNHSIDVGDLSAWSWENKENVEMLATTRPLGVEVYSLADPDILECWKEPGTPKYTGMHGIKMPPRNDQEGTNYCGV
jgi:hypothetical protein